MGAAGRPAGRPVHRLVRYDQRGHGGTPAPQGPYTIEELAGDALELLDRLGLERVSICGLSLGGAVATWLAANAADRVDRLVIACAAPRFAHAGRVASNGPRPFGPGGTEAVVDVVLGRWFTPGVRGGATPGSWPGFREAFCAVNREGYAGCCEALADWDATPHLRRILAPTLVLSAVGGLGRSARPRPRDRRRHRRSRGFVGARGLPPIWPAPSSRRRSPDAVLHHLTEEEP